MIVFDNSNTTQLIVLLWYYFKGPTKEPECLVRVSQMTGKPVTFYEANLCDRDSLRVPFRKVTFAYIYFEFEQSILKTLNEKHIHYIQ